MERPFTDYRCRPSNYGSRIDYILCSPGLRPWIKGGDIQSKVFGSDHCPVYIDLHDSITTESGEVLHIRDQLNSPNRPPSTVPIYPTDPPRAAPEPPRFATKFLDEFSGKQQTLKSFFGGGAVARKKSGSVVSASPTPTNNTVPPVTPLEEEALRDTQPGEAGTPVASSSAKEEVSTPFGLARAAFESIDEPKPSNTDGHSEHQASGSRPPKPDVMEESIDMTGDDNLEAHTAASPIPRVAKSTKSSTTNTTPKPKVKPPLGSQTKLSNFFQQPPNKAKRKASATPETLPQSQSLSKRAASFPINEYKGGDSEGLNIPAQDPEPDADEEALIAQAVAEADADREEKRAEQKAKVTPKWNELFAKKLPPLCTIHQKPCKDFSEPTLSTKHHLDCYRLIMLMLESRQNTWSK